MAAPMTTTDLAQLIARTREQSFYDETGRVVATLRRIIEDVETYRDRERYGQQRSGVDRAGSIAHELTWGFANCDLQRLIKLGAEADAAHAAAAAAVAARDAAYAEVAARADLFCDACGERVPDGPEIRDHAGTLFCSERCQVAWEGPAR